MLLIRQYVRANLRKTFSTDQSYSYVTLNDQLYGQLAKCAILNGQMNDKLKGKLACFSTLNGKLIVNTAWF